MGTAEKRYEHLEYRPGSNYRTMFIKGRRIRATVIDEAVHGPEPRTPEEIAEDFQIPLEAVREALDYVANNQEVIWEERRSEKAALRAMGLLNGPAKE
jgi:uncharacterized protein (DUF433 family)